MGRFVSNSESGQLISGFPTRFNTFVTAVAEAFGIPMDTDFSGVQVVKASEKGANNGVATLNSSGRVVQLPAAANTSPGASRIPISDANGKIAAGWLPINVPNGIAGIDGNGRVTLLPAAANVNATPSGIPLAGSDGKISTAWLNTGAPNGLATLNSSGRVVQLPADAQVTPAPNKIPISGASGMLDPGWLPQPVPVSIGRFTPANNAVAVQEYTYHTMEWKTGSWDSVVTYNNSTHAFTIPQTHPGYYLLSMVLVINAPQYTRLAGELVTTGNISPPNLPVATAMSFAHPGGQTGVAHIGVEFLMPQQATPVTITVRLQATANGAVHGTIAIHRIHGV